MSEVLLNLGSFFVYAIIAVFVENAVLARGLGVSRLVKLVSDTPGDGLVFCALLSLVQVISAPLGFFANSLLSGQGMWYREYVRPLALVLCATAAYLLVMLVIRLLRPANAKDLMKALPLATFNVAILGPMLISQTQSYNFVQTMGFAFGSAIGYYLAVLVVTEGQRKMNNRNVPATFKGLPINLLYIGILALAYYGLTGHRVAI